MYKPYEVFINNVSYRAYVNLYSTRLNELIIMNVIGYNEDIRKIMSQIRQNKKMVFRLGGGIDSFKIDKPKEYSLRKKTESRSSGVSQLVVEKKNTFDQDSSNFEGFIYTTDPEKISMNYDYRYDDPKEKMYKSFSQDIVEKTYNLVKLHTSIPLLDEWKTYLAKSLHHTGNIRAYSLYKVDSITTDYQVFRLAFNDSDIYQIIQNGIKNKEIEINANISDQIQDISGMDQYNNTFSDVLAEKIKDNFHPKFDPEKDEYSAKLQKFDRYCQSNKLNLYHSQKAIIQSTATNLNKNDVSMIIGEMGAGKTVMAMGSIYAHANKDKTTSIILSPGTIVNKWKEEVEKYMPNAEGIIVSNMKELKQAETIMREKNRKTHLFLIMSVETAKLDYNSIPAAIYDSQKKVYRCPDCFQIIKKTVTLETGSRSRNKEKVTVPVTHSDFFLNSYGNPKEEVAFCNSKIPKSGFETEEKICGAPLWGAIKREAVNSWVTVGSKKWVNLDAMDDFQELLEESAPKREDKYALAGILQFKQDPASNRLVSPTKYAISKYVHKNWKYDIDYLIADEIHEYRNMDRKQGQAFNHLVTSAKKTIGLTGTLLNGYANSIFPLLYSCYPNMMEKEGFAFDSSNQFAVKYGVTKVVTTRNISDNKTSKGNAKVLPGVSPLVFTNFLLENCAFITMDDLKEGMVSYDEIPIGVDMTAEQKREYENIENQVKSISSDFALGKKLMGSAIKLLNLFPDSPYGRTPLIHPDTYETIYTPPSLDHLKEEVLPKEEKALEIIEEKVAKGEKVLVYYEHTNASDIGSRLVKQIEEKGIKVASLSSRQGTARKRKEWIDNQVEKGIDVLITNPSMVKTGLDLLDFTTILFFEVPYDILTLRQASRRSWRLTQTNPVQVYFLYYKDTTQEQAMDLISKKLQASLAIEGKFSEEGLQAMTETTDILMKIANDIVNDMKARNIEIRSFGHKADEERVTEKRKLQYIMPKARIVEKRRSRKNLTEEQRLVRDISIGKLNIDEVYQSAW